MGKIRLVQCQGSFFSLFTWCVCIKFINRLKAQHHSKGVYIYVHTPRGKNTWDRHLTAPTSRCTRVVAARGNNIPPLSRRCSIERSCGTRTEGHYPQMIRHRRSARSTRLRRYLHCAVRWLEIKKTPGSLDRSNSCCSACSLDITP